MATRSVLQAAEILARTLDNLGVTYAILGGAACAIMGSPRMTGDIDLVISVVSVSAYDLANTLKARPEFTEVDEDGLGFTVPAIITGFSAPFPVEIFDAASWPNRPQYTNVERDRVPWRLPSGHVTYLFSPAWLLREKISVFNDRGTSQHFSPKYATDLADITFIAAQIPRNQYGRGLLDFRHQEVYRRRVQNLLNRPELAGTNVQAAVFATCRLS